MSITKDEARQLLHESALRATAPRLAVLRVLAEAQAQGDGHCHPHFLCEECSRIACLPAELAASMSMAGPWAASIQKAVVQLRGECPDCLRPSSGGSR